MFRHTDLLSMLCVCVVGTTYITIFLHTYGCIVRMYTCISLSQERNNHALLECFDMKSWVFELQCTLSF